MSLNNIQHTSYEIFYILKLEIGVWCIFFFISPINSQTVSRMWQLSCLLSLWCYPRSHWVSEREWERCCVAAVKSKWKSFTWSHIKNSIYKIFFFFFPPYFLLLVSFSTVTLWNGWLLWLHFSRPHTTTLFSHTVLVWECALTFAYPWM